MLRTLLCALVALAMVAGVAVAEKGKKGKNKGAHGKFVSYNNGTLTISTKKGGTREFKVPDGTPVRVFKDGAKKPDKLSAPDGFKDVAKDTRIGVRLDENGNVKAVAVNRPLHKKKVKT